MNTKVISRSRWLVWLLLLALPPLGLVWTWAVRAHRLRLRLVQSLLAVVLSAVYLHYCFGLRVDFTGNLGVIVEFWSPRRHLRRLERAHAEQKRVVTPAADRARDGRGADAASWPGFRGPNRDGIVELPAAMAAWPAEGLKLLWRTPVGEGYASMAVADGRIFTIEQRGQEEVVACYDLNSGAELWRFGYKARFSEALGGPGPRATPAVAGDRLFALGACGHLHCLDTATGRLIWRVNILEDNGAENLYWGMAASPLVDGSRVLVTPGGRSGGSIAAYHAQTGRRLWRAGDRPAGYASLCITTLAGRPQLLYFNGESISGHNPDDGYELWSYPWKTQEGINAAQPIVVGHDRLFISSAYGMGSVLLKIVADGDRLRAEPLWKSRRLQMKFSSAVVTGGHVYGLDGPVLTCLELATGRRCWKGARYGYGQLLLIGDWLVVLAENGDLAQVRPSPQRFDELCRFHALSGKTWNHPAVAGDKLLVRNAREMACYQLPLRPTASQTAASGQ